MLLSLRGLVLAALVQCILCPPVDKKGPQQNETQDFNLGLEYNKCLQEVVQILESDPEFRKKLEGAKAEKKNADEAAEAEETWQDQCLQKTFKVVREFEGGQKAHGFEGLCVKASLSEANETMLTLFGSGDKENLLRETVRLEFCREVEELEPYR